MPTVTIDGFQLYYEVHGDGFPLVFAHGVGGNHASWFNQVAALAGAYRVVVFDQRGFGNSRDVAGGPGRSRFVEDLRALLDHLEIERAVLVGQSLGGGTCTGFTVTYPARVAGLVLADTLVGLALPPALEGLRAEAATKTDALSQVERVLGPTFRRREPALTVLYGQLASFNVVNRKTLTGSFAAHSVDELAATGVPILFVAGSEDVLFPPSIISAASRLVPGSRYVEVPAAGHSAYFEAPAAFNQALVRFLDEVGIPGRAEPAAAAR